MTARSAPAAVEVLILDLDGVIRHWDVDAFGRLALEHGLSRSDLAAIAFQQELLHAAMIGVHDADEWAMQIGRRAAETHGTDPAALAQGFVRLPWRIDGAMVALAGEVRAAGRARVVLFSNASTRLDEDLVASGLGGAFDQVFNSARLGRAKPDPAAFTAVVAEMGAEPGRCLFVDDTVANVAGARQAGLNALVFTGIDALRGELVRWRLL
jgi:putative hydrolase of the HAD superfamily